ncbi:MAG: hypothetical protein ACK4TA_15080 [Saprospiraceae bacterium]
MKQTFTSDHLLRYIYRETTTCETLAIEAALREDDQLWNKYERLHESYRQLPKATFRPSSKTIQNILAYSKQAAVEKQA